MSNRLKISLFLSLLHILLVAYFFFLLFFFSNTRDETLLHSTKFVHSSTFHSRVQAFFNVNHSCNLRFFMIWISSPLEAFGDREFFSVESLFKSHPEACLVIVSDSLDSYYGTQILRPFLEIGFRVMAITPDFDYLFKDTHAESWFNRLEAGDVDIGIVPIGQNLSNLLRLALLYKFGGIYIDTDVIVLKSFSKLRNTIGAQSINDETGKWSRLNNAVMVFDKGHPLILEFIEEFTLTFNGSKWGNNGPNLVTRVVSRMSGSIKPPRFDITIVPPSAFYPLQWYEVKGMFVRPRNEKQLKWISEKLRQIRNQSLALHFWNSQSKQLAVEKGSILDSVLPSCCIFCESWND